MIKEIGVERMPAVVFVTASDQYALRAFEVHALDYLIKPFTDERFHEALARAKRQVRQGRVSELSHQLAGLLDGNGASLPGGASGSARRFVVKSGGRVTLLPVRDVDWIEAEGDYARLHVGKTSPVIRDTMKALEAQLDPTRFIRIHRSTIVNIERVKELQPMFKGEYVIVLFDGTVLKLSRGYRDHLEARLGKRI